MQAKIAGYIEVLMELYSTQIDTFTPIILVLTHFALPSPPPSHPTRDNFEMV